MSDDNKMFEKESIGKLLFKLSVPIIIGMLVSELYNMVDTYFVGNYADPMGIGGLVVVFPIQRIIIALSMMIGIGTSTAFSRARGSEDLDKARATIKNGFTLVGTLMIPLSILIYIFAEPILKMLGASGAILGYGMDYLKIIIIGSTFLSMTMFTSNIMIATGNSKISIMSTSIGAILNMIVDYILVKKMHMGVTGAAIATTLSQIAGFCFAYYHLSKMKKEYGVKRGFSLNPKYILPILTVGISAFIVEAEDGILMAVLNNLLQSAVGEEAIIVLGITSKIYMFLFLNLFGISSGMQPIAAYNAGAKNYKRLGEVLKKTTIFASLTTLFLWSLCMIFTPQIVSFFVDSSEVHIIGEAVKAFRIMISLFPLVSVYYISIFYFQAIGKARSSVVVSILRQLVLMLPISIILVKVFNLGAMGVWLAYPIGDLITSIISVFLMRREVKDIKVSIKKEKKTKEKSKKKNEYILN